MRTPNKSLKFEINKILLVVKFLIIKTIIRLNIIIPKTNSIKVNKLAKYFDSKAIK